MHDAYGRRLRYLRVSLTDACNLRCIYCMPEDAVFRPAAELMQDAEILALVRAATSLGVDKIRLTGGEPTVRRSVVDLVRSLRRLPGVRRVTMTSNGILLGELARPLAEAGLDGINISVDSLDAGRFRRITRGGALADVWRGVAAAEDAGLRPIKLNCAVMRGVNDDEVVELARLTLVHDWDVRFIELMPLGSIASRQQGRLTPSAETRARIESALGPLAPVAGCNEHEPARAHRLDGARGRIGFISSVTEPFCADCDRLRLTADGKLRLCLLRDDEVDLLSPLRRGADFETIRRMMAEAAWRKPQGHGLPANEIARSREMSQIGG